MTDPKAVDRELDFLENTILDLVRRQRGLSNLSKASRRLMRARADSDVALVTR